MKHLFLRSLIAASLATLVGCGISRNDSPLSTDSTVASTSEACRFLGDAYESKVVLPKGSHKGECADTTTARSVIRILDDFPKNSDRLLVANVSHAGSFWIADFPRDGVEEVLFQMERFPAIVPAAHTQIRLRFKENSQVILKNQLNPEKQVTLRDFVLSAEALGQKGWSFDLMKGMKGEYLINYRITSLSDKFDWMIVKQKHQVIQWPLKLSAEDKQKILPAYLALANKEGMNKLYHTLSKNCTNELFRVMDSTLRYGALSVLPINLNPFDEMYPVLVKSALDARGLIQYVDNPAAYPPNRPLDKTTHVPDRFDVRWPNLEVDPTAVGAP